ncbi:hypothetical protein GCM10023172_33100 [Hymenobacter ginsengisoli]|uniref:Uncharacterized protein n=1 Tax=Hymenobacter ginsengisoli TaxID=1051626 RepID=A0ABP8QKW5_9BACT|nr:MULTISPECIES: hypothetical protein [unclassified Hymenobacter]MBO2031152.1 hypothetical protein [Hymenobacter sp. BT559]
MTKLTLFVHSVSAALLVAALPLAVAAQTTTQEELLRRGNLIGGRPHASEPRNAATTRRVATTANADPVLAKYLHENIDVSRVPASQLPDLYSRFIEATRAQRRQWSARDWDEASDALARLNSRYEAVRKELPLEDRLSVRSYQGEFRTLQGARRVKDRVNE